MLEGINIALVLRKIRPGAQWSLATTYDNLKDTWEDAAQSIPTIAEIEAGWREVVAERKKATITARRNALEAASPFEYMGYLFDYDPTSRERLSKAMQAAQRMRDKGLPESAPAVTWKLYDNTSLNLTIGELLDFSLAEAQRSGALHATANELKATVDEALANGYSASAIQAMPEWV